MDRSSISLKYPVVNGKGVNEENVVRNSPLIKGGVSGVIVTVPSAIALSGYVVLALAGACIAQIAINDKVITCNDKVITWATITRNEAIGLPPS